MLNKSYARRCRLLPNLKDGASALNEVKNTPGAVWNT